MTQLDPDQSAALEWIASHRPWFDATAALNPFASTLWAVHYMACVPEASWRLAVVEAAGSALLLQNERGSGGHWRALANYYTSLYSPVCASGAVGADQAQALARALDRVRPRIATLRLQPLSEEDARHLEQALRAQQWHLSRFDAFGNWYLPCEGVPFDTYLKGRPSQLVNTWKRKLKQFRAAGGELTLVTQPGEGLERALQAYDTIYSRSWKKPEPYPSFVPDWARKCASAGWLRLAVAWLDGEPLASQFWFTCNQRANIFKLAYDEAQAKWSAGTLLSALLFQHSLDVDRVHEIDYLTGDDSYKAAWVTHRRQRVGLLASNLRTVGGLISAGREFAGNASRAWRQRSGGSTEVARKAEQT